MENKLKFATHCPKNNEQPVSLPNCAGCQHCISIVCGINSVYCNYDEISFHSINHKFDFVDGCFDMKHGELICVPQEKHMQVLICFKASMNVPFAKIKLHSKDRYIDAKEVFDDATRLGEEIAKRWNSYSK